jgi:hypothetical protein
MFGEQELQDPVKNSGQQESYKETNKLKRLWSKFDIV